MKKIIRLLLRITIGIIALLLIIFGFIGIRDDLWHLIILGALLFYLCIDKKPEKGCRFFTIRKLVRTVFLTLTLVWLFLDGILTALQINASLRKIPASPSDMTMLILGTGVEDRQPGTLLKFRLDTAVDYLKAHPDMSVIVSGKGSGAYTEAEVMYHYLLLEGISPDRIYSENQAMSTFENFRYSMKIVERESLPRTLLVTTNNYHQWRASLYAKEMGITTYPLSAPTSPLMLFSLSERERFIFLWHGVKKEVRLSQNASGV